jgi:FO synthase subunit 2
MPSLLIGNLLERALAGDELSAAECLPLTTVHGSDLWALMDTADQLRQRQVGPTVTYVVNRNINFTNVCIKHCGFCAFSRDFRDQTQSYYLPEEEIMRRVDEAVALGATEVCVQAGLPPKMDGNLYIELARKIKTAHPQLHLHAFSPEEVLYGAVRSRVSVQEYLQALKEAGLDTLPGTSAEILDQEMRERLAAGRITVDQWVDIVKSAHRIGLRTTSTMMFGHLEQPHHWLAHMNLLREIQKETGGFTEFVPLSFVHQEAPMYRSGEMKDLRRGPSGFEVLRLHALARVFLGGHIPNLQVSWVKEGLRVAQMLLDAGVNDLGGTLMNESISTSAGARHGQLASPLELRELIWSSGRPAAQRNTRYEILRRWEQPEADLAGELDVVADAEQRFGSYHQLVASTQHRYQHPNRIKTTSSG